MKMTIAEWNVVVNALKIAQKECEMEARSLHGDETESAVSLRKNAERDAYQYEQVRKRIEQEKMS